MLNYIMIFMKHIKLFENWVDEIKLPRELDPANKRDPRNIWHDYIQERIHDANALYLDRVEFKSFSDYDFWKNGYKKIRVNQSNNIYQLENCYGIPETPILEISYTKVKSLKGLENKTFDSLTVQQSPLENLKYCPSAYTYNFKETPLLSYYGVEISRIDNFVWNLCGAYIYKEFNENISYDVQYHANRFCKYSNHTDYHYFSINSKYSPWQLVYFDPNDVENYEFLFLPFWQNSEDFREKAQSIINEIDLGKLRKEQLW